MFTRCENKTHCISSGILYFTLIINLYALVKRMKLLWQCSVRVRAPPPNISCDDVMIYFGRSVWELCSSDSTSQGKQRSHLGFTGQGSTRLVLHMDPALTSLLFLGDPVPPQAKSFIGYHGSFPTSSKLSSSLLLHSESVELFPKLKHTGLCNALRLLWMRSELLIYFGHVATNTYLSRAVGAVNTSCAVKLSQSLLEL